MRERGWRGILGLMLSEALRREVLRRLAAAALAGSIAGAPALAQDAAEAAAGEAPAAASAQRSGMRERFRPQLERDAAVTEEQARELTLTLTEAATRELQVWVRTAGALDPSGRVLTACVRDPNAGFIAVGQRVRAFPPDSKSSMNQARVTSVAPEGECVRVEAQLTGPAYAAARRYVMEIVVDRGDLLSIPNEAIIEEGDRQIVYWQMHPGHYVPKEIRTGVRGELYAEVVEGLAEGDQVVTIGSFFIDAETKLSATSGGGHAHQHH
jgi:Cu(I)/Ag(I) efflux system membrane fusion protein